MSDLAASPATPDGEPLVRIRLVPVEVFGADEEICDGCGATIQCGYGLMDAVPAWSDCNRAIGRIYRVDEDHAEPYREPGDTITVYVPQSEVAKLERVFGDDPNGRCPSCHVPYASLPSTHRVTPTPLCETVLPHEPTWNLLPFGGRRDKPPWKCRWHGWVEDATCKECHREHAEYQASGNWWPSAGQVSR